MVRKSYKWEKNRIKWPMNNSLAEVEKNHILKILQANNGNRMHTADDLGISIRGLRLKLTALLKRLCDEKIGIDEKSIAVLKVFFNTTDESIRCAIVEGKETYQQVFEYIRGLKNGDD